ncbi:UNVERIFIED_CONTAM: hypothetical protein Sindi_0964000, partial [Sesamum indicum]
MLMKASLGLFYYTSHEDEHFVPSDVFVKEWNLQYFFVSSPNPWPFPTSWNSVAPDLPRYSERNHLAPFKLMLKQMNAFHYDPRELVHLALLFHNRLSPKEVDKAISERKNPGGSSSSMRLLARVLLPLLPRKLSLLQVRFSSLLLTCHSCRYTSTFASSRKRDKLGVEEIPSLLKEEYESSQATDFAKGLLAPTNKSFLKSLPGNKIINLLASCASKMVLLIGDMLERGGPAEEEAQKKEEELEGDMHENERQYEAHFTHLRSE